MKLDALPPDLKKKVEDYAFSDGAVWINVWRDGTLCLDGDFERKDLQFLLDILEEWSHRP